MKGFRVLIIAHGRLGAGETHPQYQASVSSHCWLEWCTRGEVISQGRAGYAPGVQRSLDVGNLVFFRCGATQMPDNLG